MFKYQSLHHLLDFIEQICFIYLQILLFGKFLLIIFHIIKTKNNKGKII